MKKKSYIILFFALFGAGIALVYVLAVYSNLPFANTLRATLPFLQNDTASPTAGNGYDHIPSVPKSLLKYHVVGSSTVSFHVELKFDNSYYDYDYDVDMGNEITGYLYIAPPSETGIQISVVAISDTGKTSEPLIFTNKEWWNLVENTSTDYALEHTFSF